MHKFLAYSNGYICHKKKNILYINSKMHYKHFFPITDNKFSHLPSIAGVAMYRSKLMALWAIRGTYQKAVTPYNIFSWSDCLHCHILNTFLVILCKTVKAKNTFRDMILIYLQTLFILYHNRLQKTLETVPSR